MLALTVSGQGSFSALICCWKRHRFLNPRQTCIHIEKSIVYASSLLKVLETCVKNCGHRFHVLVSSQDFVEGVLVRTILPKNNPPAIVHDKVLTLIQVRQEA